MRGIAHGPEEVQARMTLLFITNLDALNQTFTVKILIDAKWKCPEADFDEASRRIGILDVSWVPTWAPILSVDGTVEENVLSSIFFVEANEGEQLSSSTAKASGDGGSAAGAGWFGSNAVVDDAEDLWIRARFVRQLVVIDRLNLRAFPFDVQDCDVTLVGINVKTLVALADGDDTSYIGTAACLDPAGMAIMTDFQLYRPMPAIYRLVSGEAAGATAHGAASAGADGKPITEGSRGEKGAGETAPPGRVLRRQGHVREYANVLLARFARQFDGELESGGDKAELRVVVFYRRNWHAYVYDTYLLLFLIGSSALASWGIHWREIASRLSYDVTLLLVSVAFKQALSSSRPPVAYLTLLDWYTLLVIIFLFFALTCHGAIGHLIFDCDTLSGDCTFRSNDDAGEADHHAALESVDRISFYVFLGVWLLINAAYLLFVIARTRYINSKVNIESATKLGYQRALFIRRRAGWYEQGAAAAAPAVKADEKKAGEAIQALAVKADGSERLDDGHSGLGA